MADHGRHTALDADALGLDSGPAWAPFEALILLITPAPGAYHGKEGPWASP